MDNRSKETRSSNMSHIPSKNTKPEEMVCKYLFRQGLRYRKNVPLLPGKPDIVLPKYHTVVFVNGCFWHAHNGCKYFVFPKTNEDFWAAKFKYNTERDELNYEKLRESGWIVLVVWGCQLKPSVREETLKTLYDTIVG